MVGAGTSYAAGAYMSDDPASYLLSQEAGIDLLTGGIFGGAASLPGVVTFGAAARFSAGAVFRRQAIGFGILNVAQGEISTFAKSGHLGQIPEQSFAGRVGSNFLYGFFSPYIARGGIKFGGQIISRFSRAMEYDRIPIFRKFTQNMYSGYITTRKFYSLDNLQQKQWTRETGGFIATSYARVVGMTGYDVSYARRPISEIYEKVIVNSNILPIFGNQLISAINPVGYK